MNAVRKPVEELVQKELSSANRKFPLFHSYHEASAVLLEEIEEMEEATEQIRKEYNDIWDNIKMDYAIEMDDFKYIEELAVCVAIEAIQVAAMAQKAIDSELY